MSDPTTGNGAGLVLVAHSDDWLARAFESVLESRGYTVRRTSTGHDTLDLVRTILPDALIIGTRFPDIDALQVCAELRDDPNVDPAMPIIMTCQAPIRRADRIDALNAGAWAVYSLPADTELLALKLERYLRPKRELDLLRAFVVFDIASGLYNERGMHLRAREIMAEARRRHTPAACVIIASDGRRVGTRSSPVRVSGGWRLSDAETNPPDPAEAVAKALAGIRRESDAVGRLGPLEFMVVAPMTDDVGARRLAQRYLEVARRVPIAIEGARPSTWRAGYAAVPDVSASGLDAERILAGARAALEEARQTPGAMIVPWSEGSSENDVD